MKQLTLQTEFVTSLSRHEAGHVDELDERWYWTGWQRRQWPATIEWKGKLVYGFDSRKESRKLCALLRVKSYAVFDYCTWDQFRRGVQRACDWSPDADDAHAGRMPFRKKNAMPLIGFAMRWELKEKVDIPLSIKTFPQLGWYRIADPSFLRYPTLDVGDLYGEGGRRMRTHQVIERNSTLRHAAKTFWRGRMGGRIRCWTCSFDFGNRYGALLGEDFIEMHHERWLSNDSEECFKKVSDLLPVCSNCHRMIHRYPHMKMTAVKLKKQLAEAVSR